MKAFVQISMALGLSVALAACGGSSTEPAPADTNTAAATPDAAATPAAAPAPAADNVDTVDGTKFADMTGDATHGKAIFIQCQACHSRKEGENKIGPSLAGVVGRAAGSVAGFQYSDANKNSGITWSPEKLYQYLENPQRVVPGTKMTFVGLPKGQDRADVIAYLQTPPE